MLTGMEDSHTFHEKREACIRRKYNLENNKHGLLPYAYTGGGADGIQKSVQEGVCWIKIGRAMSLEMPTSNFSHFIIRFLRRIYEPLVYPVAFFDVVR